MEKSTVSRKKLAIAAVLLSLMLLVFAVVNGLSSVGEQEPGLLSTKPFKDTTPAISNMTIRTGLLIGYTVDELMKYSGLVVYGTVTHISEPFAIECVEGGYKLMTDMTITPIKTLRGEEKKEVKVRLEGGQISDYIENYDDLPEFLLGEEWLLFLNTPNMGGSYHTEGDYYYITGLQQGAFKSLDKPGSDESKSVSALKNEEIIFVNSVALENGREISSLKTVEIDSLVRSKADSETNARPDDTVFGLAQLETDMKSFNSEVPVDEYHFRNFVLGNYEANLKSGFFSQEEYDRYVSNIDKYATVMSHEESEQIYSAAMAGRN